MMLAGVRFGAIAGVIAFASTLGANVAIIVLRPADLCRVGPRSVILLNLAALFIFLLLAAAAGFAAGRADGSVPSAVLAGVVVGAISGCALVALIPFGPAVMHRLLELSTLCPDGGSFSFGTGTTPPPGVLTPSPGSFAPPPGAFVPLSGPAGLVLQAIGLLFVIGVGTGLATGAAALGGLVGAATRPGGPGPL